MSKQASKHDLDSRSVRQGFSRRPRRARKQSALPPEAHPEAHAPRSTRCRGAVHVAGQASPHSSGSPGLGQRTPRGRTPCDRNRFLHDITTECDEYIRGFRKHCTAIDFLQPRWSAVPAVAWQPPPGNLKNPDAEQALGHTVGQKYYSRFLGGATVIVSMIR